MNMMLHGMRSATRIPSRKPMPTTPPTPSSSPIPPSRAASTTRPPPRISSAWSRPRRPNSAWAGGRQSSCPTAYSSAPPRPTRTSRGPEAGQFSMPSGVFKPYAGVSTAILLFTKTSLYRKRLVLRHAGRRHHSTTNGPSRKLPTSPTFCNAGKTGRRRYSSTHRERSFLVPKAEIAENEYDLSINRYKEIEYEEVEYDPLQEILRDLRQLEEDMRYPKTTSAQPGMQLRNPREMVVGT